AEQLPTTSAPDSLWSDLEQAADRKPSAPQPSGNWILHLQPRLLALAVIVLLLFGAGGLWLYTREGRGAWVVPSVVGAPRIGSKSFGQKGKLRIGQWLETDKDSRAQIEVGTIGQVEIDPNIRVRLVETKPTEHRLELARGRLSAHIWAPPRLFFVDTPSAVAADYGCAYTLDVNDSGASVLRVTAGWVALELKDRESMVPSGAACETRPGIGPGTPYFEEAAPEFRKSLTKIDFDNDSASTKPALDVMLSHTRKRDTLTLWHLLARVDETERGKVFDKIASFVPPPTGVTREGILNLDQKMLDLWRDQVEPTWAVNTTIPKEVAEAYRRDQ